MRQSRLEPLAHVAARVRERLLGRRGRSAGYEPSPTIDVIRPRFARVLCLVAGLEVVGERLDVLVDRIRHRASADSSDLGAHHFAATSPTRLRAAVRGAAALRCRST